MASLKILASSSLTDTHRINRLQAGGTQMQAFIAYTERALNGGDEPDEQRQG